IASNAHSSIASNAHSSIASNAHSSIAFDLPGRERPFRRKKTPAQARAHFPAFGVAAMFPGRGRIALLYHGPPFFPISANFRKIR
ncbi:MAG: hypothetical protein OXN81_20510, partial [Alphaproteobacteria bacterium]|nr:hypothetical protein [Alphaproteobacteria bacterium]